MDIMTVDYTPSGAYRTQLPRVASWPEALEAAVHSVVLVTLEEVGAVGVLYPDTTIEDGGIVFEVKGWLNGYPVAGDILGVATAEFGFEHCPGAVEPGNEPVLPPSVQLAAHN